MDDDEQYDDETGEQTSGNWRRELERRAKDAEKRAATLERDLAFRDAGLNPSADPRLSYFVKGYDGEVSPEAIRQAATDAGFIGSDSGLDAHARLSSAAAGAPPAGLGGQGFSMNDALRAAAGRT